jgi:glucosylceramidase
MPHHRPTTSRRPTIGPWVILVLMASLGLGPGCDQGNAGPDGSTGPELWLSDPARNVRFEKQSSGPAEGAANTSQGILVDPSVAYQEMDGFGFALTGGSALHIHSMSAPARADLLDELFSTAGDAIGTSYLRVSIGASDLDEEVFSYVDLPSGQTDPDLEHFTLDRDREHLIPVLKEILAINPDIRILGSPWSPPVWMKTNGSSIGGSLLPEYYESYAQYFVKYVQGMAVEGITIDAITVQNEPLHPGNNPSMLMPADEQAAFVRDALGPAFRAATIATKIIIYDHNADRPDYPISVLNDQAARAYIDGSAFHLYGGSIDALSEVHAAHPDKNLYFTEQWIGAPGNFGADLKWHVRELIVGAPRNWCRAVVEWNLAADQNQDPHTPGGCTQCLGAVTIQGDVVTRNPAHAIIAHASKFVRPGSRRIASTSTTELPNVAFSTPSGDVVVIVLNNGTAPATFNLVIGDETWHSSLPAGAVGTYVME